VTRFLLRRFGASLLLLYLVLTTTFFLIHLAPGDPIHLVESERTPRQLRESLERIYGLGRPLPEQYVRWLGAAVRGEWGSSFSRSRPVTEVIADALKPTAILAFAALAVEYGTGLLLGIAAARRQGSLLDHAIRIGSLVLASQPVFWLGLMAVLLFSVVWRVLPASQMRSYEGEDLGSSWQLLDLARHLILPALVLGISRAGGITRFVRGSLLEQLGREHVRAARARGLSEARVIWVHALRNAIVPLIQLFALSLPSLLSGALVIEVVFSWPGLGRVTYEAVLSRDYPLVLATTALTAALVLLGNLLADLLHAAADPRVRHA
jgi:peptide/nickel transport system permease protein